MRVALPARAMRLALVLLALSGCAAPRDAGIATDVLLENLKPGAGDWWVPYPQWSMAHEVEAYTDRLSYAPGERVTVMISTAAAHDLVSWRLLRTGWYAGRGARDIDGGALACDPQPVPAPAAGEPVRANWSPSLLIDLPADALSGVYALRLDSKASGKSFFVTFVVRQDRRAADLVFVRADFTDEAYNPWDGGGDTTSAYLGATWVSFDRPLRSVAGYGIYSWSSGYFVYEYPLVRWLERRGYDVSYVSDVDLHDGTARLWDARALIVAGHDEYWSDEMRDNVERARDGGLDLGFFGSDLVDGEIRFFPGDARSFSRTRSDSDPRRNEWADKPIARGRAPHDNPSDTLTGAHLLDWCGKAHDACNRDPTAKLRLADDFAITDARHPIFRGVRARTLPEVLGYEYEAVRGDHGGLRSLHVLARADVLPNGAPAVMVAYTAPSGAKVVNLGSMHWAHALDDWAGRALLRVQGGERDCLPGEDDCFVRAPSAAARVTTNILTDFGVLPANDPPVMPSPMAWPRASAR